jgi:hypothetical protein
MVLAEAAWDSLYVAKDDGFMDVNIKTVGRADTQETEANNLESACANYSATRGLTGTAVPAAAANAAGGLPISTAGGLDMDAKLAATNEVTAERMGALTDLIDGGRLDLLIDAIKAMTDKIGTVTNSGGTATLGAILGDFANSALVARLAAIVEDTNELQTNQGNWLTAAGFSTHSAADVKTAIEAAGSHLTLIKAIIDAIGATGTGLTAIPWNASWDAEVQSEVADALNAAMPASPTADSLNQYIQQLKWVLVNQMSITEANGNVVGLKDDDISTAYTVAAAFTSAAGVTLRKRLEA